MDTTVDETIKSLLTHLALGMVFIVAVTLVLVACHAVAEARSR